MEMKKIVSIIDQLILNTDTKLDSDNYTSTNFNWDNLRKIIASEGIEILSSTAFEEWLSQNEFKPKSDVATFDDLPRDPELKEVRAVVDENTVYTYNGTEWVKLSNVNLDGLSEVKQSVEDITLNARSFGVDPNSINDQTLSIQKAIDSTPEGGTLTFPKSNYVGTFNINKSIRLDMKGSTITPPNGDTIIINAKGTRDIEDYVLNNPLKRGDKAISLSTTPAVVKGDLIVVKDDSVRASDGAKNVNMEVHEVLGVSGNSILIKDFIRLPKTVSTTSNVYKINPIKGLEIVDLIQKPVDDATTNHGIYIEYCRDIYLNNTRMTNGVGPAVVFKSCYNFVAEKFDIRDAQKTGGGQGYGIQAIGGTMYGQIDKGYADGLRHTIDCGNAFDIHTRNVVSLNTKASHFVLSHNGWDSDNSVTECYTSDNEGGTTVYAVNTSSIGTGTTYDIINYNIRVEDNTFMLPSNGSSGIVFPKVVKDGIIKNNLIIFGDGSENKTVYNTGIQTVPVDNTMIIEGNTIKGATDALKHYESVSKAQDNAVDVISVIGNVIENCTNAHTYQFARTIKIIGNNYKNISNKIHRLLQTESGEKIQYLTIRDSYISGFVKGSLFEHNSLLRRTSGLVGEVKNINVDTLGSNNVSVPPDYLITLEDIVITNGLLRATPTLTTGVTLHPTAFHKGLVEGQRFTILKPGRELNIPHNTDYVLNKSNATLSVDRNVEYVFSGDRWWEV